MYIDIKGFYIMTIVNNKCINGLQSTLCIIAIFVGIERKKLKQSVFYKFFYNSII